MDIDRVYQPDVTIHSTDLGGEPRGPTVAVLERPEVKPMHVVVPVAEEFEETFLVIEELPGRKLVTVVEVLSPTNKRTAEGRKDYLRKRDDLIRSRVSLVEIDLMRGGTPMPLQAPAPLSDYRILICRAGRAKSADLYMFPWTTPIPLVPIPLLPGDAEPNLDLNAVLHALVDRARYDLVIDYRQPPQPPLRPEDSSAAAEIIAGAAGPSPESTTHEATTP